MSYDCSPAWVTSLQVDSPNITLVQTKMDLLDFFDLSKEFKPVVVEGSHTQVQLKKKRETVVVEEDKKTYKGREYATEYQRKEEEELKGLTQGFSTSNNEGYHLTQLEELTSIYSAANIDDLLDDELLKVYEKYDFNDKIVTALPIAEHKEKIVSVIDTNQVTIIQGSTGCGKTTQVPQFILDSCREKDRPCRIIVTQPRRIAAITIAKRVCQERNWELGTIVGYQVGLKAEASSDTLILYCTTGILLQKLITMKHMSNFTHVILDEVHERDVDTDFALLVVRRMLRTVSPHVKVVLMSATINVARFSNYFSFPMNNKWEPAPVIDLDKYRAGKSKYRINIYYLCELKMIGPLPEIIKDEPCITNEGFNVAVRLIKEFDRLEEQGKKTSKGAVLVFLPGILEIEQLYVLLDSVKGNKWWVRPLHSTITSDEQEMVFRRPPPNHRKIILSTNIAESSVTVPDIVYVIDFCLTKELTCDPDTNYSSLQLTWASKSNCIQRAGRSGRVADGRVYRLVPRDFYDQCLAQEGIPEILRCPLSKTVLRAKLLNMGEPKALLALAMDPPDLSSIESTILLLKEAGALLPTVKNEHSDHDGDITFMGRVMAKLPTDVHIAKLILLGHVFSVLEDCIIMGAAMSVRNMFSTPFRERLAAYHSKLTWADSSCSDCIAFLNAYKVWKHHKISGFFKRSAGGGELSWSKRFFIQLSAMHEVDILVRDLTDRLRQSEIVETVGPGKVHWSETEHPLVLKIVMAGAFYPNYFVRGAQGGQVDEREAVKSLAGHNPYNSVYLQGMPMNQPGRLYAKQIKESLKGCAKEMRIYFDGSSKVYVEFGRMVEDRDERKLEAKIPGKVSMAVYRAIKLRQLKVPVTLNMMLPHLAAERAKELGLLSKERLLILGKKDVEQKSEPVLPSISTKSMDICITHIIDAGHFWARSASQNTTGKEMVLLQELNSQVLPCLSEPPIVGAIYVAPYSENPNMPKQYYRARINAINPRKGKEHLVEVFFVDYGNTEFLSVNDLRNFSDKNIELGLNTMTPLACEFVLCEIKPSELKNPRGVWSDEAIREFRNLTNGKAFTAEIYSVVHGVVSVELFKQYNNKKTMSSLNKTLIELGYAEPAEESYLSKINHEMRIQQTEWTSAQKLAYDQQQDANLPWVEEDDPEPPKPEECRLKVELKGPKSPLEMKLYNLTKSGQRRDVTVEWNSVNSVLLDTDPQDPHERMLVAATVTLNPAGDRMNLRHTTLLPNIHGLPALLCLIFAPEIELRTNESITQYTGALCGLGCNPNTGTPIFPDHDLEVTFDTEITLDDIQTINRLRYWMSMALYTEEYQETLEAGAASIIKYQQKVKSILFELLKVKRKDIPMVVPLSQFTWKLAPNNLLLSPGEVPGLERVIFRLHYAIELQEEDEERRKIKNHLKYLHYLSTMNDMQRSFWCELCNVRMNGSSSLRIHLESELHKGKELNLLHTW